ncbi:MAG: cytochrome P450 [Phenylobacterium sp.]|jgi:cytochrome P450|uniref:cytochrome P450 n=1 Tax=Phenylobacterium sp. TaxID=1871053 RepID=UPI002A36AECF|nr:cytochrome P450 [Phenylobacterium sp.]MDX9999518.1 cytochrome P450 [Phenylobacterium sp.]
MADGAIDVLADARALAHRRAYETPLETLNPAWASAFRDDAHWAYFDRLRAEDPVHWTPDSNYGPFWSITKYNDIMAVDTNHQVFSSAKGIALTAKLSALPPEAQLELDRAGAPSFIGMDPPDHDVQRKTVSPAVAPARLHEMAPQIRERAGLILDSLPIGEPFDWVDLVSKELTTMTLATLFDFPFEERRKLTFWSDTMTTAPGYGPVATYKQRREALNDCRNYFIDLWNQRVNAPPAGDLISMLAHGPETRDCTMDEFFANVTLLIIGGNDTTRNTISGSVFALNRNPDQYDKLRANPDLIPSMVSETIRWQTPLAHMARVATQDFEFRGKQIREGDRVVMWYVSGNRDDEVIENPYAYIIDRPRPRQHLSFGFGIHRCVGNRLAELQLTIIWEEILKRFPEIRLLEEPKRTYSIFVKGYEELKVLIPARH